MFDSQDSIVHLRGSAFAVGQEDFKIIVTPADSHSCRVKDVENWWEQVSNRTSCIGRLSAVDINRRLVLSGLLVRAGRYSNWGLSLNTNGFFAF